MKKSLVILMILAALLVFPLVAFGKSSKGFDTYLHKGDLAVSAGVGLGYLASITLYPGVEYFVYQTKATDIFPLTFGVSGKGFLNFYSNTDIYGDKYGWFAFGVGAFGTVHWGLKGADIDIPDFLRKFDLYWGLGLIFSHFKTTGTWSGVTYTLKEGGIGISSYGGFNYFINDNLAIFLEGNYWSYGGGAIGIYYKL